MADVLLYDLSNMLYFSAYRMFRGIETHPNAISLLVEAAEDYMRELYRQFRPQSFCFACDDKDYWRKDYFPDYKGNRPNTPMKTMVRAALDAFKTKHQKYCIQVPRAEADDVIYVATQRLEGVKVIISTDQDFLQLLSPEVKVFNPLEHRFRRLPHSAQFALFMKCIRGDTSDNIPSSFPRVTEKRLKKAFACEIHRELLLNQSLEDGSLVKEHFERNRLLMDLSCSPKAIQKQIIESLEMLFVNVD